MPGLAEDATAAAAATTVAGAAADAEPAHHDGLQSETHVTSHVTTRSKRHGPDPSEEQSRAKRPKQELSEDEQQRAKRPKQEPSEEEACAKSAQLSRKRQKADSPQGYPHTANTAKANDNAELAESVLQSNSAVHANSGSDHKLDAKGRSPAEPDSDSDSGQKSHPQGQQTDVLTYLMCSKRLLDSHVHSL